MFTSPECCRDYHLSREPVSFDAAKLNAAVTDRRAQAQERQPPEVTWVKWRACLVEGQEPGS